MTALSHADQITLRACANSNDVGSAFMPGPQYAGNAGRLVEAGLLTRGAGLTGGFWISVNGRRQLGLLQAARLLKVRASAITSMLLAALLAALLPGFVWLSGFEFVRGWPLQILALFTFALFLRLLWLMMIARDE